MINRLILIALSFCSLVSCGTNTLDSNSIGRLERGELVSVETANAEISDDLLAELLFGWIDGKQQLKNEVRIESVDGIPTSGEFFRNNQRYALTPGAHAIKVRCVVTDENKGQEQYHNEDVIQVNLVSGYRYFIEATYGGGNVCNFKVEMK
jgi:hypothetical protein